MSKEGAFEQVSFSGAIDGGDDRLLQMLDVIRNEVGQVGILGVVPNHLNGIEIRSIAGQPFHFQPRYVGFLEQAHGLAMRIVPIQDQDELAPQMAVDQVEKGDDVIEADVVLMQLEVHTQTTPLGRHGEGGDDREPVMAIPAILDRCLPLRCPGTSHDGLKHEAAFVDYDDAPSFSLGFFLIRGQSSLRHCWMASSSRSRARRSGFCGLQSMARRIFQT